MDIENIDTEWKESWSDKYLKTMPLSITPMPGA